MRNASNKYIDAVARECVLVDLVTAFEKHPKAFLAQLTDHPQVTLDQFSKPYGVQLQAADVLHAAIYLALKKQQGHDLTKLLADLPNSSASLLAGKNGKSRKHTALFQTKSSDLETTEAAVSTRSYK